LGKRKKESQFIFTFIFSCIDAIDCRISSFKPHFFQPLHFKPYLCARKNSR
jgi:hypothetical protein